MTTIADIHKSAGFKDPTSNYLVTKHMRGVAKRRPSVDVRSPLSPRDLKRLIEARSTTGFSTFVLLRAIFVLMFFAFLCVSDVSKRENKLTTRQFHVTQSKLMFTFLSYKHSKGRPFNANVQPTYDSSAVKGCLRSISNSKAKIMGPSLGLLPLSRSYICKKKNGE